MVGDPNNAQERAAPVVQAPFEAFAEVAPRRSCPFRGGSLRGYSQRDFSSLSSSSGLICSPRESSLLVYHPPSTVAIAEMQDALRSSEYAGSLLKDLVPTEPPKTGHNGKNSTETYQHIVSILRYFAELWLEPKPFLRTSPGTQTALQTEVTRLGHSAAHFHHFAPDEEVEKLRTSIINGSHPLVRQLQDSLFCQPIIPIRPRIR